MVRPTFLRNVYGNVGGTSKHDGQKRCHIWGQTNRISVEMIEQDYPIRINQYGLVPDIVAQVNIRWSTLMREYESLRWCAVKCSI